MYSCTIFLIIKSATSPASSGSFSAVVVRLVAVAGQVRQMSGSGSEAGQACQINSVLLL